MRGAGVRRLAARRVDARPPAAVGIFARKVMTAAPVNPCASETLAKTATHMAMSHASSPQNDPAGSVTVASTAFLAVNAALAVLSAGNYKPAAIPALVDVGE